MRDPRKAPASDASAPGDVFGAAEQRAALDELLLASLGVIMGVVLALMSVVMLSRLPLLATLPPHLSTFLRLQWAYQMSVYAWLLWVLKRGRLNPSGAHPLIYAVTMLLTTDSLWMMMLAGHEAETLSLGLTLVAIGLVYTSWRWFWLAQVSVILLWGIMVSFRPALILSAPAIPYTDMLAFMVECLLLAVLLLSARVTAFRRLFAQNRQLMELDRLKSNFVNSVTHELRTPLTSIQGYAEFLEDQIGGPLSSEQQEFVAQIQHGARRLRNLVDDLLDFARIEAGTFRLVYEEADFSLKVGEVIDSLRPQAALKSLSLRYEAPVDEALTMLMDGQRVEQVLINLLNNAIKFTPPGGSVTVRAFWRDAWLRCEVEDTGIGILEADLPRLFKRFSQVADSARQGGSGLGLSISKLLVEAHGGHIAVQSTPGVGSCFWFELPRALEGPGGPAPEPA